MSDSTTHQTCCKSFPLFIRKSTSTLRPSSCNLFAQICDLLHEMVNRSQVNAASAAALQSAGLLRGLRVTEDQRKSASAFLHPSCRSAGGESDRRDGMREDRKEIGLSGAARVMDADAPADPHKHKHPALESPVTKHCQVIHFYSHEDTFIF